MAKFFTPFFFLIFFFVFFFVQAEICIENNEIFPIVSVGDERVYRGLDFWNVDYKYKDLLGYNKFLTKDNRFDYGVDRTFLGDRKFLGDWTFLGDKLMNKGMYGMDKDVMWRNIHGYDNMRDMYGLNKDLVYGDKLRRNWYGADIKDIYGMDKDLMYGDRFNTMYGLNKDFDYRNFLWNKNIYNKDMTMDKTWLHGNGMDKTWLYGKGMDKTWLYGKGMDKNFMYGNKMWNYGMDNVDKMGLYGRKFFGDRMMFDNDFMRMNVDTGKTFMKDRLFMNKRAYDYTNEVGDFIVTGMDMGVRDLMKKDIGTTLKMDFFKHNFNVIRTVDDCQCVCPMTIPKGIFKTGVVTDFIKKDVLNRLWNNRRMPQLSILGKRMKFALLNLINSDVTIFNKHATLTTFFISSFLPHINHMNKDLGRFNKLIDYSLMMKMNRRTDMDIEMLDVMKVNVLDAVKLITSTVMYNGRCGVIVPKLDTIATFTGDVDMIHQKMWEIEGDVLPENYKLLVRELLNSAYFPDRLMGTIATMVLSPEMRLFLKRFDRVTVFEILNMLGTGIVPECCCDWRMDRLHKLMDITKIRMNSQMDTDKFFFMKNIDVFHKIIA